MSTAGFLNSIMDKHARETPSNIGGWHRIEFVVSKHHCSVKLYITTPEFDAIRCG